MRHGRARVSDVFRPRFVRVLLAFRRAKVYNALQSSLYSPISPLSAPHWQAVSQTFGLSVCASVRSQVPLERRI